MPSPSSHRDLTPRGPRHLSVTGTTVTIGADSTGFGAFTSGGSGTSGYSTAVTNGIIYDGHGSTGSQTLNQFQNAAKAADGHPLRNAEGFSAVRRGGRVPVRLFLFGPSNQWSKYEYLHSTPSPQVDPMSLLNNRLRRKRLVATP